MQGVYGGGGKKSQDSGIPLTSEATLLAGILLRPHEAEVEMVPYGIRDVLRSSWQLGMNRHDLGADSFLLTSESPSRHKRINCASCITSQIIVF